MSIESLNRIDDLMTQFDCESAKEKLEKLEFENKKLREALEKYAMATNVRKMTGRIAREVLDEIEGEK